MLFDALITPMKKMTWEYFRAWELAMQLILFEPLIYLADVVEHRDCGRFHTVVSSLRPEKCFI